MSGTPDQYWAPGIAFIDTLRRYALLRHHLAGLGRRAHGGERMLIVAFAPTLRVLRRFQARFRLSAGNAPAARLRPTPGSRCPCWTGSPIAAL
ncbi:MAG: hypothetical protein H6644_19320 [Caldilineaceae bacterium]|nr:hypothetical protein [Caldilineaceae bacterium]